MTTGDTCIVFDYDEWRETGDIGDNSKFYKKAIIIGERFSFNRPIVDVRFNDGRVSNGHFKEHIKPINDNKNKPLNNMDKELSAREIMDEEFSDGMFAKLGNIEINYIEDAMNRYADQQAKKKAIAFSEWKDKNTTRSHWNLYSFNGSTYTIERLYESQEFREYFEQQKQTD